jgi:hypothetical protein
MVGGSKWSNLKKRTEYMAGNISFVPKSVSILWLQK